jgi:hypothetical protein
MRGNEQSMLQRPASDCCDAVTGIRSDYSTPHKLNNKTYTEAWLALSLDPIDRKHASTYVFDAVCKAAVSRRRT